MSRMSIQVGVVNGPSKPALQAALGNSREHPYVAFAIDDGSFEARIDACEELGGSSPGVVIRGHIASGPIKAARSSARTIRQPTGSLNLAGTP
jgi:hypothetical protein